MLPAERTGCSTLAPESARFGHSGPGGRRESGLQPALAKAESEPAPNCRPPEARFRALPGRDAKVGLPAEVGVTAAGKAAGRRSEQSVDSCTSRKTAEILGTQSGASAEVHL